MQWNASKYVVRCFLVYSRSPATATTIHFRTFSSPQITPNPLTFGIWSQSLQPQTSTDLLSVGIVLLGTSYKCNHTVVLFFLTGFLALSIMFIPTVKYISTTFLFFSAWIMFRCVDILHSFINSSVESHLDYICSGAIMKNDAINICVQASVWTCVHFFWIYF